MINELRQGELDFTINTYYQDRTTTNLLLRNYWKSNSRSLPPGTPRHWCPFDQTVTGLQWTMPTPHGSYYKQLSELLDDRRKRHRSV